MLTTRIITLPTPEQRAVYAACEERYVEVLEHRWPEDHGTVLEVFVKDAGSKTRLYIAADGTTRAHYFAGVPTRLYGPLPGRLDARREWGKGMPPYALKFMPNGSLAADAGN